MLGELRADGFEVHLKGGARVPHPHTHHDLAQVAAALQQAEGRLRFAHQVELARRKPSRGAGRCASDELAKVAGAEDNFAVSLAGGGVLTKNAKRLPDDRSETQRSFPEFFVDSLNQKGWQDVRYTPMSVLNPEHPNFVSKAAMERKQKDDEARKYGSAEGPPPPGTNRSKFRF